MSFISSGYTATLGGSLLLAGGRLTTTVSVPGARAGMHVKVTPQSDPGVSLVYGGFVSANDTVTVWLMAILGPTPASTIFNVSVEQ